MKKLLCLIVAVAIGVSLNAQQNRSKIQLVETEHNFGRFSESAGRQTYDFVFTNVGTDPLVIQNISVSCGCTTPEWTRSPIPPGGKGKITAIYDPQNKPGAFNQPLTVHTNSNPSTVVLTIRGEVTPRERTVEETFTFPVGTVRFESNHLAFTNVKKTEQKSRTMPIINTSDKDATVEFINLPQHLTLRINPATLRPGQRGVIEGTYDGTKNSGWGNVSDMVRLRINGVNQESVFYYVSANLTEDFSTLTRAEIDNAPVFKVASTTFDIGKMKGNEQKDVEFRFQNTGKRDLEIRYIRSTCGCTAIQQGGNSIVKPGEWSTIKATFNAGGISGRTTKTIFVYTNDPKNSEVTLMLTADVEPAVAAR
jgi:hypothetical protein